MLVGIWSRQAAWRAKVFVVAVHLQCSHFRPFFFFFCNSLRFVANVIGLAWLLPDFRKVNGLRETSFFPHIPPWAPPTVSLLPSSLAKKVLLFALLLQLHLLSPFFFYFTLSFLLHTLPVLSLSLIIFVSYTE